ncbi:MAG: hypothetical protein ACLSVG_00960 [Clostridia bacterium]
MNNTIRIFKNHFKTLLLLSLMIVLPVYLIQEFLITPALPGDLQSGDARTLWYMMSMWLISLFLYVYRIAVIKLSYDALEEKSSNIPELMDFSVRLWPKILLTTLLYAISVTCGMMLFFFPGLILFVSYTFYQYVAVRSGLWGRKALFLSSLYTKKSIGKAAAIAFGTVLIRYILSYSITFLESKIPNVILAAALGVLLFLLVELATCLIDIYVSDYIFHTKIEFDLSILQKKKSSENAEH